MRIGFTITARLKSTRLPLKLLMNFGGSTVIESVIDQIKLVSNVDEVILCTSSNPQDRPLVEIAQKKGIKYFIGDEMDVLKRLKDAAKFYDLDYIISITGENPFLSPYYSQIVINEIISREPHYTFITGLPIGVAPYGLNVKALESICEIKSTSDTEIWGLFFNQPEVFKVSHIKPDRNIEYENLRLTVDYMEDYLLLSKIRQKLTDPFDIWDINEVLNRNPELLKINSMHVQESIDKHIVEKTSKLVLENKEFIKNNIKT